MAGILWRCQQRLGQWVGSSVVHLGDHNVPNALMFIDKYTQARSPPHFLHSPRMPSLLCSRACRACRAELDVRSCLLVLS
jgi:hypothetical protein